VILGWLIVGLVASVAAAALYARHARRRSRSPRELVSIAVVGEVPTIDSR
jgi:hypothetical protein